MTTPPRRVVLNTNVVVSALLFRNGRLAWLPEAVHNTDEFWSPLSADGLARAFDDDEPEYSAGDVVRR